MMNEMVAAAMNEYEFFTLDEIKERYAEAGITISDGEADAATDLANHIARTRNWVYASECVYGWIRQEVAEREADGREAAAYEDAAYGSREYAENLVRIPLFLDKVEVIDENLAS